MPPKTVILVRHAESNENALMQSVARGVNALRSLSLPAMQDLKSGVAWVSSALLNGDADEVTLSENGERQVEEVRNILIRRRDSLLAGGKVAIAHSPLLRARETMRGLFRDGELITQDTRVVELESLREIEPKDYVAPSRWARAKCRIAEFEQWIASRDEDAVVVVGHSHYFRTMLGVDFKFSNCEVWRAKFSPEATDPQSRWYALERLCGSSTSKPTFGAEGPDAWRTTRGGGSSSLDEDDVHDDEAGKKVSGVVVSTSASNNNNDSNSNSNGNAVGDTAEKEVKDRFSLAAFFFSSMSASPTPSASTSSGASTLSSGGCREDFEREEAQRKILLDEVRGGEDRGAQPSFR